MGFSNRLVLFGAGHMGTAIARGMLRSGATNLFIVDPDCSKLQEFASQGIPVSTACTETLHDDILMLAMPPQAFLAFSREVRSVQTHPGLVISVMAGV